MKTTVHLTDFFLLCFIILIYHLKKLLLKFIIFPNIVHAYKKALFLLIIHWSRNPESVSLYFLFVYFSIRTFHYRLILDYFMLSMALKVFPSVVAYHCPSRKWIGLFLWNAIKTIFCHLTVFMQIKFQGYYPPVTISELVLNNVMKTFQELLWAWFQHSLLHPF